MHLFRSNKKDFVISGPLDPSQIPSNPRNRAKTANRNSMIIPSYTFMAPPGGQSKVPTFDEDMKTPSSSSVQINLGTLSQTPEADFHRNTEPSTMEGSSVGSQSSVGNSLCAESSPNLTMSLSSSDLSDGEGSGSVLGTAQSKTGRKSLVDPDKARRRRSEIPQYNRELYQSHSNNKLHLPEDASLEQSERLRNKVINEIINTEIDYVMDLMIIVQEFIDPIEKQKLLKPQEINQIFSNVTVILDVNKELLKNLQVAITLPVPRVGSCFIKMSAYLKMYSSFCNNHSTSLDTLTTCCRKYSSFNTFCQNKLKDPKCRGLPLSAYLIKPLQRICKYPLFLRELLKYGKEGETEHEELFEAFKSIEASVGVVNESKRMQENQLKIIEIQNKLENGLKIGIIRPYRRYICDAIFFEARGLNMEKNEEDSVYYCLFNDILLKAIRQKKKNLFHVVAVVPLDMFFAQDVADDEEKKSFELVHWNDSKIRRLVVADSHVQKQLWLKAIHEAKEKMSKEMKEGGFVPPPPFFTSSKWSFF